ncbi:wall-associated receptor kinase carboxy-terminal protein [Carex rostrata]
MKFLNLLIVLFLFYNFGCYRSSSCGELGNITYPYHLPGTCNWKAYELQCNGHNTVLSIGAPPYLVKDMSIENKTLRLVDPDLAEGRCRFPKQDFLYPNPSSVFTWFSIPEYSVYSDIIFFNCTKQLEDSMYKLIHCMDEPRSRIYAGFGYDIAGSIPKSCAYVASTITDYQVQMRWNDTNGVELMRMLRQGFLVSWSQTVVSFFYGPEYDKKVCSLLKHCWASAKR